MRLSTETMATRETPELLELAAAASGRPGHTKGVTITVNQPSIPTMAFTVIFKKYMT